MDGTDFRTGDVDLRTGDGDFRMAGWDFRIGDVSRVGGGVGVRLGIFRGAGTGAALVGDDASIRGTFFI